LDKIVTQKALYTWCLLLDPGWEKEILFTSWVIGVASIHESSITTEASVRVLFSYLGRVGN
jgi:hypothetical protein